MIKNIIERNKRKEEEGKGYRRFKTGFLKIKFVLQAKSLHIYQV